MARKDQNKYSGRGGTTFPDRKVNRPRGRGSISGGVAATTGEDFANLQAADRLVNRPRGRDPVNNVLYPNRGGSVGTTNVRNQGAPRIIADNVVTQQGTGHYGRGQREQVGQQPQEPIAILSNPVDRGNMLTDIMGAIGLGGMARNVQGVMPQAYWEDPFFGGGISNQVPAGWAHMANGVPRFVDGQQVFGYGTGAQFDAAGGGNFGQYRYEDDPRTSIANYNALGLEEYMRNLQGYGRGPLNTGFGYSSTGR
jgi:hypothetical protein